MIIIYDLACKCLRKCEETGKSVSAAARESDGTSRTSGRVGNKL